MSPELSVVVVSYRSRAYLERCLPPLLERSGPSLEIIVVDNAPGDGTAAWLAEHHPTIRVVTSPTNGGYAGGNNLGVDAALGQYVMILNPDAEPRPGAVEAMLDAVRRNPDALVTAKLITPAGKVNACGLRMHYTGVTACRGLGEVPDGFRGLHEVPLVSGAAFVVRREVFRALGGFDETFFMYLEDVDLSLRARLHGHPILCAGDAEIVHHYVLGMTPAKFYYLQRNRLLMLMKVLRPTTLVQLLPALLVTEAATWAFALGRGTDYVRAFVRLYAWLWTHRRGWRASRRRIQRGRAVGDADLLRLAGVALPFDQLVANARLARLLDRITRPVYHLLRPAGW